MGNNSSGSGNCFVQLPQIVYSPGDVIDGVLHLCILTPIEITSVEVKVSGKEVTYWCERRTETQNDGNGNTRQVERWYHHYGRREFFKVKVPVYTATGMSYLPPGQYSFPFRCQLPGMLPGSFQLTGARFGQEFNCMCEYKVKGVAVVKGMFKSNIKHSQRLQIHEKPPPIVGAAMEDLVHVKVCCCLNRGDFYISMRSEKNAYCGSAGEVVRLLVEMENRTEYDVDTIYVELVQRIKLQANTVLQNTTSHYDRGYMRSEWDRGGYGNYNQNYTGAYHQQFYREEALCQRGFPGIKKGQSCRGNEARQMDLQIARMCEPQCLGYMIECAYFLRVYAYIPCATNPEVRVPVMIYSPQPPPQSWEVPQAPPGWSPQMMQATTIQIPSMQVSPAFQEFYGSFHASAPPPPQPVPMDGRQMMAPPVTYATQTPDRKSVV